MPGLALPKWRTLHQPSLHLHLRLSVRYEREKSVITYCKFLITPFLAQGFTGKTCDKSIIPCETNLCENEALCLLEEPDFVCYCVPDYHGTFCELKYDDCEANFVVCQNGGACVDGVNEFSCSCLPHYKGRFCDVLVGSTLGPAWTLETTTSSFEAIGTGPITEAEETTVDSNLSSSEDPGTTLTVTDYATKTDAPTDSVLEVTSLTMGMVDTSSVSETTLFTATPDLPTSKAPSTWMDDLTTPFVWTTTSDGRVMTWGGNWTVQDSTTVQVVTTGETWAIEETSTLAAEPSEGVMVTDYSVITESYVYGCEEDECMDVSLCLNNFTQV